MRSGSPRSSGQPRTAPGQRDRHERVALLGAGARPPAALVVDYIDAQKDGFEVEPIFEVLQVAPSTHYAHR